MDREAVRASLHGPIASVRTPFARDGSIDYAGLRRLIDFDIAAGARALLLTWGDSLFALLTDAEIAALTRAVASAAGGRATVIACTGRWATPKAVEFAAFCRECGADILQVFPPFWYPGACAPAALVAHHAALAAHVPLAANNAELMRQGGEAAGLELAQSLLAQVEGVWAMKADVTGEFDRRVTSLVRDRWAVFAGGQKSFHLELWPYGCAGYLSTFITFRPAVAHAYWREIASGNVRAAAAIVERIDRPFFARIAGLAGGFDAALHGIAEICGLAGRWRRPPFASLGDAELEELEQFLRELPDPAAVAR